MPIVRIYGKMDEYLCETVDLCGIESICLLALRIVKEPLVYNKNISHV